MFTTKQTKKITSIGIEKLLQNPTPISIKIPNTKNRTLPQFDKKESMKKCIINIILTDEIRMISL